MNQVPDICIYMRRVGPLHEEQMASLARHTKQSFNLIYVYEPDTTSYQAMNHAIDRSTSQWLIIMDDDVVLLDDYWLRTLIGILKRHPTIAIVSPLGFSETDKLEEYLKDRVSYQQRVAAGVIAVRWLCGFVLAINRAKLPDIRCDENLPGRYGMSDLDMCLQARRAGHAVALTSLVGVCHPEKAASNDWRTKNDFVRSEEEIDWHKQHVEYMAKKWGPYFTENYHNGVLDILEEVSP